MSTDLALPSLEIQGYRGIRALKIERLGRANLIVGKNNVGKTSVLEAIRFYAQPASPSLLLELLTSRGELSEGDTGPVPIGNLFYGREAVAGGPGITIGPISRDELRLQISFVVQPVIQSIENGRFVYIPDPENRPYYGKPVLRYSILGRSEFLPLDDVTALLFRQFTTKQPVIDQLFLADRPREYVGPNGVDSFQLSRLWDKIALTDSENDILEAIKLISPDIERIAFKGEETPKQARIPVVKVKGISKPLTLRSMGDGVNRLFGLALALANSAGGFCLIDEIENGIHYSIQPKVWTLLFDLARRLDVQVFATSHSWDMVKAFQEAASESEEEGILIRLQQGANGIRVTEFDEEELEVVARKHIEVR